MDLAKARDYNAQRHADKHFEALAAHGWLPVRIIGAQPGSDEEAQAVAEWQQQLGVDVDGCCGPGTWAAACKLAWPDQPPIPKGRHDVDAVYGNPGFASFPNPQNALDRGRLTVSPVWKAANIVTATVQGHTFACHRLVKKELEYLTALAVRVSLYSPACAGVFVPRRRNWSTEPATPPSNHSWGAAVDFNAHQNARGRTDTEMRRYRLFPAIFEVAGWCWGGTFQTPDDMHLQRGQGF